MSNVTVVDARNARVVDSEGRIIEVRKISAVNMMKLYAAAGPEKSEVDRYMGYAILASSVFAIDDKKLPFPRSAGEVESVVANIGEEGLEAVATALKALAAKLEGGETGKQEVADAAENL